MVDPENNGIKADITERLIQIIREMPESDREALLAELEERTRGGKRLHRRKPFMMVVDYGDADGSHLDFIQDISAGGVFIGTRSPFAIGDEITLTFPLPFSRKKIQIIGEVVRTSEDGVGVKFKPVDASQREEIESLLKMI